MVTNSRIEVELAIRDLATDEIVRFANTIRAEGGKIRTSSRRAAQGIDDTTKAAKALEKEAK
ncbi:MAG: hypothetical protein AAFP86_12060, partial [Planctomycetota bacterium]